MRTKLLILGIGVVLGATLASILAPEPAISQGVPEPVSISAPGDGGTTRVLYDNHEVWGWDHQSQTWWFIGDMSYPGSSAVRQTRRG